MSVVLNNSDIKNFFEKKIGKDIIGCIDEYLPQDEFIVGKVYKTSGQEYIKITKITKNVSFKKVPKNKNCVCDKHIAKMRLNRDNFHFNIDNYIECDFDVKYNDNENMWKLCKCEHCYFNKFKKGKIMWRKPIIYSWINKKCLNIDKHGNSVMPNDIVFDYNK